MADAHGLLAIYLNDHLAGAVGGLQLARRAAAANDSNEYGRFLSQLAGEIEADLHALEDLMDRLGVGRDRIKLLAAWSAEKVGRLKLNGRLLGYSPLSRVVELEALSLGVQGKLSLWRALQQLADGQPRLRGVDLDDLVARAQSQRRRLESRRVRAVVEAFEPRTLGP
jgi:hypothetical protein